MKEMNKEKRLPLMMQNQRIHKNQKAWEAKKIMRINPNSFRIH